MAVALEQVGWNWKWLLKDLSKQNATDLGFPVGLLLGNPICGTPDPLEAEGRTAVSGPSAPPKASCTQASEARTRTPRLRFARRQSRRRWLPGPERDPFRRWQSVETTYWRAGIVAYRETGLRSG